MKIYEVTVPYLTTVKHIVKVDPDNMPPLATSPANYARIIAEERNIKEGEILYIQEIHIDTGLISPSTVKEIK